MTTVKTTAMIVNMKTQTIHKLEKWLARDGNTPAKLAFLLGYQTTATIQVWIKNKKVPRIAERHVLEIIQKEEK